MNIKNFKYLIILIIPLFLLTSCNSNNNLSNKALEQGKLAFANKEYENALSSFNLAIEERLIDNEINEIISILKIYLESINLFEEKEFEKASKTLNTINKNYKNYDIKTDVDKLFKDIKDIQSIEKEYTKVLELLDNNNLEDAMVLKEEVDIKSNNYDDKNYFIDLKENIDEKILKIAEKKN